MRGRLTQPKRLQPELLCFLFRIVRYLLIEIVTVSASALRDQRDLGPEDWLVRVELPALTILRDPKIPRDCDEGPGHAVPPANG